MEDRVNLLLQLQESEMERLFLINESALLQGKTPTFSQGIFQGYKKAKGSLTEKSAA